MAHMLSPWFPGPGTSGAGDRPRGSRGAWTRLAGARACEGGSTDGRELPVGGQQGIEDVLLVRLRDQPAELAARPVLGDAYGVGRHVQVLADHLPLMHLVGLSAVVPRGSTDAERGPSVA